MAKVSVLNVAVLENPSPFHSPFRFEISFECNEALADGEIGPLWRPHSPELTPTSLCRQPRGQPCQTHFLSPSPSPNRDLP